MKKEINRIAEIKEEMRTMLDAAEVEKDHSPRMNPRLLQL